MHFTFQRKVFFKLHSINRKYYINTKTYCQHRVMYSGHVTEINYCIQNE